MILVVAAPTFAHALAYLCQTLGCLYPGIQVNGRELTVASRPLIP